MTPTIPESEWPGYFLHMAKDAAMQEFFSGSAIAFGTGVITDGVVSNEKAVLVDPFRRGFAARLPRWRVGRAC